MTPDRHAWVRARLDAHALGLLSEADEGRFAGHLAGCAECARAHEVYSANLPPDEPPAEHLPASLVASWARTLPALGGLERRLVREHLESCEACRADLRVLGHEPVLARDEALETGSTRTSAMPEAPQTPLVRPRAERGVTRAGQPGGRLLDWLLGGAGGALVASGAWLLLVVVGPLANRPILSPGPAPSPIAAVAELATLTVLPEPVRLPAGTRSAGGAGPIGVTIDSTSRSIQLRLPEGTGTPDSPVHVIVCWPGGATTEATFRFGEVAGRATVLLSSNRPLPPGDYEVDTTFGPEPGQPESTVLVVRTTLHLKYAAR